MKNFFPMWNASENRLVHFGLEFIPVHTGEDGKDSPMSKKEAKDIIDADVKANGKVSPINRQIKQHYDKLEKEEKQEAEKTMDKKLMEEDAMQTPEQAREALTGRWLEDIAKEYKVDGKSLTLGEATEKLRSPEGATAESWDVLVNGESVGTIFAGFKNGKVDHDEAKYDFSDPNQTRFKEAGFKEQVRNFEAGIKPKNEK